MELTTATRKVRRVGTFNPELVKRAIDINQSTRIVLNHFDYVDADVRNQVYTLRAQDFLNSVERAIGRHIDWVGIAPDRFVPRSAVVKRLPHLKVSSPA